MVIIRFLNLKDEPLLYGPFFSESEGQKFFDRVVSNKGAKPDSIEIMYINKPESVTISFLNRNEQ